MGIRVRSGKRSCPTPLLFKAGEFALNTKRRLTFEPQEKENFMVVFRTGLYRNALGQIQRLGAWSEGRQDKIAGTLRSIFSGAGLSAFIMFI